MIKKTSITAAVKAARRAIIDYGNGRYSYTRDGNRFVATIPLGVPRVYFLRNQRAVHAIAVLYGLETHEADGLAWRHLQQPGSLDVVVRDIVRTIDSKAL